MLSRDARYDYDLLRSHQKLCLDALFKNPIIFEDKQLSNRLYLSILYCVVKYKKYKHIS